MIDAVALDALLLAGRAPNSIEPGNGVRFAFRGCFCKLDKIQAISLKIYKVNVNILK